MTLRDWDDPQYKEWRLSVLKRDSFCCKFPGCTKSGKKARLQVHHIRRWADSVELRFQLTNGITLCYKHHKQIEGIEENYVQLFSTMVNSYKPSSAEDLNFKIRQRIRKALDINEEV